MSEQIKLGDRLSGQTEGRRVASAGSSPAPPTRSARTRLWKRLRRLDRQIHEADEWLRFNSWLHGWGTEKRRTKVKERRFRLDAQRKATRMKLKGYKQ
jgi:hypothetical protein